MQSDRPGQEHRPRGSPRPVRHQILILNGPDPCDRPGVRSPAPPQHRRDHLPAAFLGSISPAYAVTAPCSAARLAARQASEPAGLGHQEHGTARRCTRIHRFQAAVISYPDFYPNRRRSGAGMLYLLATAIWTLGHSGISLKVSHPANRQPDPGFGRSAGGDHIDPGGAAVQRGHDPKPHDDLAAVR